MTEDSPVTGRPASFSRQHAIDRAMHLFWRDGYLSVTARDLAAAMRIQRSSFYNSFQSKEAVFVEALERYVEQAPDAALDAVEPGQKVIPVVIHTLREICRVRAADKHARGCLVCNSVAELIGVDRKLGRLLNEAMKRRTEVMRSLFARAVEHNEVLLRTDVDKTARAFVVFLLGLNVASKTIRDEFELWSACMAFLVGIGLAEERLKEYA